MKSYITPHAKAIEIDSVSILAASNSRDKVFSYFNSTQVNEIRNVFAHMNSSLTFRQKLGLMAIMSNFAIQAGRNKKDVVKALEFYLISIGLTESEIGSINSRSFNTFDEMIDCVKTIGDRSVYENLIIAASGLVFKANNDIAWGMYQEVCESLGYTETDVEELLKKTQALTNHFFDN